MVVDDVESESEDDEEDESNKNKWCDYMEIEVGDSDGCISKRFIGLSEVELQSCDVKEEGMLEY